MSGVLLILKNTSEILYYRDVRYRFFNEEYRLEYYFEENSFFCKTFSRHSLLYGRPLDQ